MITAPPNSRSPDRGLNAGNFLRIGERGLGDVYNSYAHSCAWFNGQLYIGTTRYTMPLWATERLGRKEMQMHPFPVRRLKFEEMDLRGQIRRYDPRRKEWELAYRAPIIDSNPLVSRPGGGSNSGKCPLALSFRNMAVFQGEGDDGPALYTIPTQGIQPARRVMLRNADGQTFEEIPQPILPTECDGMWRSFRGLVAFKGRLFTSPSGRQDIFATINTDNYKARGRAANTADGASVRCSRDPRSGLWEQSSPPDFNDPTNCNIFDLGTCGDYLYAGTLNVRRGFQLWRSTAEGPGPHTWELVLDRGADRGSLNQGIISFAEFQGNLYLGTCIQNGGFDKQNNIGPAGAEVIRVYPDGTWDLVVGEPRHTRQGFKVPTSGLGPGFGMQLNGYIWRMTVHQGVLYAGTSKIASILPYVDKSKWPDLVKRILDPASLDRFLEFRGGSELWRTTDGNTWIPVTLNGFDNRYNGGFRSLLSTPEGLFVGSVNLFGSQVAIPHVSGWRYEENPRGGVEVWQGRHDFNQKRQPQREQHSVRPTLATIVAVAADRADSSSFATAPVDLDIAPDFDGAADSDSSIDEMIYAMQNADLLDPFDSMAMIDVDFHEFGATVADEIDRYFQHSPLRLVGYWFDRGQTPKDAGLSLIRELTSSALTARPREESIASLVIGSNGGAVAHALLQLNAHNQVTILAFDKTSIHQARNIVPQATVVAGRESRLKLSADRFDLIVWVEGPDLRERERTLGQIRRALKPGGLFAATNLVSHSPVIPPAPFAEISDRYRAALEAAGLAHLRILDGTDLTWTRFLENSRAYFRTKLLFGELERDRYQSILRELPGGDDMVDAYVIVYASKPATEQS